MSKIIENCLSDQMFNHEVVHYQMYQYMHAGDEIGGLLDNY